MRQYWLFLAPWQSPIASGPRLHRRAHHRVQPLGSSFSFHRRGSAFQPSLCARSPQSPRLSRGMAKKAVTCSAYKIPKRAEAPSRLNGRKRCARSNTSGDCPLPANEVRLLIDGGATFDAICARSTALKRACAVLHHTRRRAWTALGGSPRCCRRASVKVRVMVGGQPETAGGWAARLRDAGVAVLNPDPQRSNIAVGDQLS